MLAKKSRKRYLVETVVGAIPYILFKPIIVIASKEPYLQQYSMELNKYYNEYRKVKGVSGRTISKISKGLRLRGGYQLSSSDKIIAAQTVTKLNMVIATDKIVRAIIEHAKIRAPEEAKKIQSIMSDLHQLAKYKAQEINEKIRKSPVKGTIEDYGKYVVAISKENMRHLKAKLIESMENIYGKVANWRQANVSVDEQQLLNKIMML